MRGGKKEDRGPAGALGSLGGGVLMGIGALACLVTGKAPDKGKGCCQVSTREENSCNWHCNVFLYGVLAVVSIVFGIYQLMA
mmetsp:Transcript_55838/g.122593  ORF Transcript_55838/g.122593 Transcript_55838/m.122593 type:complete len:82 (-) Transcript_55838:162-407(-)